METKIQLQKNANVVTANGELVGYLERVVLNPDSRVISQIVVRDDKSPDKEERVVPINFIAHTTENEITLREDADDLESFSLFEEKLSVDASEYADMPTSIDEKRPPTPGFPDISMPVQRTAPGQEMIPPDQQNIRQGTVAMKEGAKVIDVNGEDVGTVERVLADPSDNRVTDLLVSRGLLMKDAKLIPAEWVTIFDQEKIRLRVKKDSVEKLEDFAVDG